MATYSEKDFNSSHYNDARPNYPDGFYTTLIEYHKGEFNTAVDIGCGSGFVAFKLVEFFSKVYGTDVSSTMIEQCRKDKRSANDGIAFLTGSGEQQPFDSGTIDMITGAECCHWVDHPKFFKESYRVLKPNGTLAYWFYKDPIFVDYPQANQIYDKYCYESPDLMGPCYQQPGRALLRSLMKEVEVPLDMFYDVVRVEYEPLRGDPKSSLYIEKIITLKDFKEYVTSWSAYHTWMKKNKGDVAEMFVNELKETLGWTEDFKFKVVWGTVYTFARRIA